MKHLKSAKKFLALFVVATVLAGTMLVANAGNCNHGGEESKFETYRTVTIGCISAGTHQCYVGEYRHPVRCTAISSSITRSVLCVTQREIPITLMGLQFISITINF